MCQRLNAGFERRRFLHHALSFVPDDPRLILLRRRRVDLSAAFAVEEAEQERDAGRSGRFAVLARDFDIGGAEAARTVGPLPPEERADDERLPGSQLDRLSGPLALGMSQEAEE